MNFMTPLVCNEPRLLTTTVDNAENLLYTFTLILWSISRWTCP